MPLLYDPAVPSSARDLAAYLERTLSAVAASIAEIERIQTILTTFASTNGATVNWAFSNSTVMGDPGSTFMRMNAVQLNAATQMVVSNDDAYGRDLTGTRLGLLQTGDFFLLSDLSRANVYQYTLATVGTIFPTYSLFNLTPIVGSTTNPAQNDIMELKWLPPIS